MGQPAARIGDMHVCPMVTPGTPPIPHVGGPVTGPGVPSVMIGNMPAAVMGDMCVCTGPPDSIIKGSTGVFIGGKPAARMGDTTAHGGSITLGCPTVFIGETSGGNAAVASKAVKVVLKEIEKLPGVDKSVLAEMKIVTAQIATMKNAAETGSALAHNPDSCSDCQQQDS